jgi:hypothetical protein
MGWKLSNLPGGADFEGPVEQATAAPGEKRNVSRVVGKTYSGTAEEVLGLFLAHLVELGYPDPSEITVTRRHENIFRCEARFDGE